MCKGLFWQSVCLLQPSVVRTLCTLSPVFRTECNAQQRGLTHAGRQEAQPRIVIRGWFCRLRARSERRGPIHRKEVSGCLVIASSYRQNSILGVPANTRTIVGYALSGWAFRPSSLCASQNCKRFRSTPTAVLFPHVLSVDIVRTEGDLRVCIQHTSHPIHAAWFFGGLRAVHSVFLSCSVVYTASLLIAAGVHYTQDSSKNRAHDYPTIFSRRAALHCTRLHRCVRMHIMCFHVHRL